MSDREKELLNCFRQLPPEDQAGVLSHTRTAHTAEKSVKKIFTPVPQKEKLYEKEQP
jgi:hypothetical protein